MSSRLPKSAGKPKKLGRATSKIETKTGESFLAADFIGEERTNARLSPKVEVDNFADDFIRQILDKTGIDDGLAEEARDVLSYPKDPISWIEANFYIPELKGPIKLYPYQKAVLREAYRKDKEGNYIYDTIVWGDIKKSAKTSIASAIAAERARHLSWGSIRFVGNSREQAASRSFYYLQRAISLNPALRKTVASRQYSIIFPNHTMVQAIPMNPNSQSGGNDSLILYTEAWAADPSLIERMWVEMTLPPNLYGKAQRFVESYAGYTGVSSLLERLWRLGVKEGRLVDVGIPSLELFANDESKTLVLWNTVPRLPWQTPEYYAAEEKIISPLEFLRVHRNMWVSTTGEFVPKAWWIACIGPLPKMDQFEQVVIGVDAAVSSDSFGVVAVSRHGETVAVREVREWKPVNGKIEFSNFDNPKDPEYPEGFIRSLADRYNVIAISYDPYQLEHLANILMNDNVAWMVPFPQGPSRAIADKHLYDLIRNRQIIHDGNPVLSEHIENADSTAEGSDKLRLVKRSKNLKIDLAVALSMASKKALELLAP